MACTPGPAKDCKRCIEEFPVITKDYRNAPSGIGPLAAEWADKPHRLIYDLCNEIERLRREASLNKERS